MAAPEPNRETKFLNTDLSIRSREDLGVLGDVLDAAGLFSLQKIFRDGEHILIYEVNGDCPDAETTLGGLLSALEALEGEALRLWQGSYHRVLDLGFESGAEPFEFNARVSNGTLRRIADVGAELMVTIYRHSPT